MWNASHRAQFQECVQDLINHPTVLSMNGTTQHVNVTCLDHSIFVAYLSFVVCRKLRWDYHAAARGGLLHDLFLYDWRDRESHEGMHGFNHPKVALKNAAQLAELNEREKDIIEKHMWPLTLRLRPHYRESFVVSCVDKFCALAEMSKLYRLMKVEKRLVKPAIG